ncbi:GH116 family glycosyl-hydrolase [Lysobacter korlensis]|uniref:GH116 family glycosyl-hydrolase n=1 Tax=Lysobacter korlensis TaxID=553636 RepID=A0ABV6RSU7_9GAMM
MTGDLGPDASAVAFPLGGIGTGNVSLGARGELRDWELTGEPAKDRTLPFSFFAICADTGDGAPIARVLQSRLQPPHTGDQGYYAGELAGLPRLASSTMRGEYPFAHISFRDESLPVTVALRAFTPLVPLDADASAFPATVLRYLVVNPTAEPVEVSIAGSLANPVGIAGYDLFHFPTYEGRPRNTYRDAGVVRGIHFDSDLPTDSLLFGSASLTTPDAQSSAKPQWVYGFWQDGAQLFWDEFRTSGRLTAEERETLEPGVGPERLTKLRVGSLAVTHRIDPGETSVFEFRLSWYFPNRPKGWLGNIVHADPNAGSVVRKHYATRFADAWDVAVRFDAELDRLETATAQFHEALFESSLPEEVVDAVSSTLTVARSTTCFRLEDGTFAAWEGSFDSHGSCEGTCTHVWNYAQSLAYLFPELERDARRTEFLLETRPDGHMSFRTNRIFGGPQWDFHPAVDGQLGTVIRLYREWRFSGDDAFLAEVWEGASAALEFAFTHWDSDGDNVLDSQKHNTYDIEFHGADSLSNSVFFAALLAGAEMAERLGHACTAARWRDAARTGAERMDALLFNGEYYEQRLDGAPDGGAGLRYQYGTGVLSDQLLGQFLAHVVGLGHVLPRDHVRSAIRAVFQHNFRTSLADHHSVQRTYALNDEAGLLLCSWPRGGRPRIPFVYSDEVWTGIEYQVASHLIYEGLVDEGLTIVRAVRDRHDGHNRNPWNEVECGNHYARSLASWGLLLALSGFRYDAVSRQLEFAPAQPGPFSCFFSTGSAWGRVAIDEEVVELSVDHGSLVLDRLIVAGRDAAPTGATLPGLALGSGSRFRFSLATN